MKQFKINIVEYVAAFGHIANLFVCKLCFHFTICLLQSERVSANMADINSSRECGNRGNVAKWAMVMSKHTNRFLIDTLQPHTVCVPPLTALGTIKLP